MWAGSTAAQIWLALSAPFCAIYVLRVAARVDLGVARVEAFRPSFGLAAAAALIVAIAGLGATSPVDALGVVIFLCGLVYLAIFDLRFLAVPVIPVLVLTLIGLVFAWFDDAPSALWRAAACVAGWLSLRAIDAFYQRLRGQSGMGSGDALLAALIGAWLSFEGLAWAIALGSGITLLWAKRQRIPSDQPVPLGPGLAIGAMSVVLARVVLHWGGA
ncbi:MAG: A24 family peptidase [Pseudomonadota bacterium]